MAVSNVILIVVYWNLNKKSRQLQREGTRRVVGVTMLFRFIFVKRKTIKFTHQAPACVNYADGRRSYVIKVAYTRDLKL